MRKPWGDQGAKVIRASGVTTILDHGVEARSAQTGKLFKRFQNEGPVKVDRRCAVDLFERRQAGLGEDTRHTVAVESQLAGEGADRPAFSVSAWWSRKIGASVSGVRAMCAPVRSISANPIAQEVQAYPVRQGAMATTARPGRRNDRLRRFKLKWNR